jgi:hypothetical protein
MIFHFPPHVILTLAGISLAKRMTGQLVKSSNPTEMEDLSQIAQITAAPQPDPPKPGFFGASRPFVTSLEQFQSEKISAVSVGIPMESPSKPTMEPVTFPNQA